jgi:hypothetical protein
MRPAPYRPVSVPIHRVAGVPPETIADRVIHSPLVAESPIPPTPTLRERISRWWGRVRSNLLLIPSRQPEARTGPRTRIATAGPYRMTLKDLQRREEEFEAMKRDKQERWTRSQNVTLARPQLAATETPYSRIPEWYRQMPRFLTELNRCNLSSDEIADILAHHEPRDEGEDEGEQASTPVLLGDEDPTNDLELTLPDEVMDAATLLIDGDTESEILFDDPLTSRISASAPVAVTEVKRESQREADIKSWQTRDVNPAKSEKRKDAARRGWETRRRRNTAKKK